MYPFFYSIYFTPIFISIKIIAITTINFSTSECSGLFHIPPLPAESQPDVPAPARGWRSLPKKGGTYTLCRGSGNLYGAVSGGASLHQQRCMGDPAGAGGDRYREILFLPAFFGGPEYEYGLLSAHAGCDTDHSQIRLYLLPI